MRLLVMMWVVVLLIAGGLPARANERTFPAGSLVIPVDSCWQPPEAQAIGRGCAGGGGRDGVAGAYGLAYRLQRAGVPIYQVDNADPAAIGFVIHGQGQAPVVELPGGTPLAPPPRVTPEGALDSHLLDYRGAPFLVDGRDLDEGAETVLAGVPNVRRHRALVPFVAPVARLLAGLPTRVAVADALALTRVQEMLELAGLSGSDGLVVALEEAPPATSAVLTCAAATPPASLLEGPCGFPAIFAALCAVPPATAPQETVSVAPLLVDGVLYVASSEFPGRSGHLRAFTLRATGRSELWDAAAGVPVPGDAALPSAPPEALTPPFAYFGSERLLFTNAGVDQHYRLLRFDGAAATVLAPQLGSPGVAEATALINAVRGRLATSLEFPQGSADRTNRLGAISRSTPAVVGASPYIDTAQDRDRVLYVGSDAGMLHAILAGSSTVPNGDGRELWGYLPGSLLPALRRQAWADPAAFAAARVDGSPAVSDQFADFDGDGRREWRTVLVGTASAAGRAGVVFALDVTDPYRPQLLWEKCLAGIGLGTSRGVALVAPGIDGTAPSRVFLTGAPLWRRGDDGSEQDYNGRFGVLACALDLVDGRLLWDFFAPYEDGAANLNAPPAPPALMSVKGRLIGVFFGDLDGRLWALEPTSGAALGGGPLYRLPGGSRTPIAAGVAVRGRTVFFGSGGADHVDPAGEQALYAVELLPAGAQLLWTIPLLAGEQLLGAPLIDRSGRTYVGIGNPLADAGRLLVLGDDGVVLGTTPLAGPPGESLALAPGVVVMVSRQGEVEQIGEWREPAVPEQNGGRVRILSWRFR